MTSSMSGSVDGLMDVFFFTRIPFQDNYGGKPETRGKFKL